MYSEYTDHFYTCDYKKIEIILGLRDGIGMSKYSFKYKISLGGPIFGKGSYYSIKEYKNFETELRKKYGMDYDKN